MLKIIEDPDSYMFVCSNDQCSLLAHPDHLDSDVRCDNFMYQFQTRCPGCGCITVWMINQMLAFRFFMTGKEISARHLQEVYDLGPITADEAIDFYLELRGHTDSLGTEG